MKTKIYPALLLLMVSTFMTPATAQFARSPQEARRSGPSVADIMKKAPIKKRVVLRGFIQQKLVKNKYLFSDGTGAIGMQFKAKHAPAKLLEQDRWLEIRGRVVNGRGSGMPEIAVDEVVVP